MLEKIESSVLNERESFVGKKNDKPYNPFYPESPTTSFSTLLNVLDPEREAQRQEYLKRKKKEFYKTQSRKKPKETPKPKQMSLEEKLKRTQQWLVETFPTLFDSSQPCKALDVYIVRDIKAHYKQYHLKNKYPDDLVIKAALYRHMESPAYLACLVEGTPRYNIQGEISGFVETPPQEAEKKTIL